MTERGEPVPDRLQPPALLPGASIFVSAFWELSTDRQLGMSAGPIPAVSIDRHTDGWDADDADLFRTCIRAMDRAFMRRQSGDASDRSDLQPMTPALFKSMAGVSGR